MLHHQEKGIQSCNSDGVEPEITWLVDVNSALNEVPVNLVIGAGPVRAKVTVVDVRPRFYKGFDFLQTIEFNAGDE